MNRDWLWDRKISIKEAKKVLKDPEHKNFISLAALLLARKNQPQQIFKEYIDPVVFCTYWAKIKKSMRNDKWNSQRIIFWQAIYEKVRDRYKKKGFRFREKKDIVVNDLCKGAGEQIRNARKEQKLSQDELAKKLGVSQQLISHIEKGRENVSLITLANILKALDKKLVIGVD